MVMNDGGSSVFTDCRGMDEGSVRFTLDSETSEVFMLEALVLALVGKALLIILLIVILAIVGVVAIVRKVL